ncbi:MAG: hypothetical protein AAGH82_01135 [Pseudomonadota bacterium]
MDNTRRDFDRLMQQLFNNPLQSGFAIVAFVSSILSVVGWTFSGGFAGPSVTFNQNGISVSSGLLSSLPMRLMAYLAIVVTIAWWVSAISIYLTGRRDPASRIASHILVVLAALLLAAAVEWIFAVDLRQVSMVIMFFIGAGVVLAVLLAKFNFEQTRDPDTGLILARAEILTTFTVASVIFVFIPRFAGVV